MLSVISIFLALLPFHRINEMNKSTSEDFTISSFATTFMGRNSAIAFEWEKLEPGQQSFVLEDGQFLRYNANLRYPRPNPSTFYRYGIHDIFALQSDSIPGQIDALFLFVERSDNILRNLLSNLGQYYAAGGAGIGPGSESQLSSYFWRYNDLEVSLFTHQLFLQETPYSTTRYFCVAIVRKGISTFQN